MDSHLERAQTSELCFNDSVCSKQLWKQHAPFPGHKGSAGREDDHYHPAAADGDYPQKRTFRKCKYNLGKSFGPVPAPKAKVKAKGGAVNVTQKHTSVRTQFKKKLKL